MTPKELWAAYRTAFKGGTGDVLLRDLAMFAQAEKEPAVRAGRLDMVAYVLEMTNPTPPAEEE